MERIKQSVKAQSKQSLLMMRKNSLTPISISRISNRHNLKCSNLLPPLNSRSHIRHHSLSPNLHLSHSSSRSLSNPLRHKYGNSRSSLRLYRAGRKHLPRKAGRKHLLRKVGRVSSPYRANGLRKTVGDRCRCLLSSPMKRK